MTAPPTEKHTPHKHLYTCDAIEPSVTIYTVHAYTSDIYTVHVYTSDFVNLNTVKK